MSTRDYPEGIKAALHVMSGGGCYLPECGEPSIRFVDGVPEKNLQIAHIHALERNGPREIRQMSIAERNSFPNLILLCGPCHKRVDADEQTYPARLLKEWKRDRERQALGSLAGLRDLDVAGMEDLLSRAMTQLRQDMTAFTDTFPELASLLRETISGLPSLDPESLHLLDRAAAQLALPDYAPMMHTAAARLDLPDYGSMIWEAAARLDLPDYAPMLAQAASDLDLTHQVPLMRDTANDLADTVRTLTASVSKINAAAPGAVTYQDETVAIRYIPRLLVRAAVIGWIGAALAILLIYLHVKGHF
jgi:hypothetical protein